MMCICANKNAKVQKCKGQGRKKYKGTACRGACKGSDAEVGRDATQVQGKGQYNNEDAYSYLRV